MTADEYYEQRDDRTLRCTTTPAYQTKSCVMVVDKAHGRDTRRPSHGDCCSRLDGEVVPDSSRRGGRRAARTPIAVDGRELAQDD